MMRDKRKKAVRLLVVTILVIATGVCYLWAVSDYAVLRDNMKFANENATNVGWTEGLFIDYVDAQDAIVNSKNPVTRWCYNHHVMAKTIAVIDIVIMFFAVMELIYVLSFIKKDLTRNRKRRRRA